MVILTLGFVVLGCGWVLVMFELWVVGLTLGFVVLGCGLMVVIVCQSIA